MVAHYSCNVKPDRSADTSEGHAEDSMHDQTNPWTQRRFGRPPKPRDEVRSERVVSFVTRAELEALNQLADTRGDSLSALIHGILRSALAKQLPKNKGLVGKQP